MDRWVTLPKRVTSPTWGPPPPCAQTLKDMITEDESNEKLILQQLLSLILSKMNENNK